MIIAIVFFIIVYAAEGDSSSATYWLIMILVGLVFLVLIISVIAQSSREQGRESGTAGDTGGTAATAASPVGQQPADVYTMALEQTKLAVMRITPGQFQRIGSVVRRGKALCNELSADRGLKDAVYSEARDSQEIPDDKRDGNFKSVLEMMIVKDLLRCLERLGHPVEKLTTSMQPVEFDYTQPEAQALYAVLSLLLGKNNSFDALREEIFSANDLASPDPYTPEIRKTVEQSLPVYMQATVGITVDGVDDFGLVLLLWHFDRASYLPQVRQLYLDFCQVIASVDASVDTDEKAIIKELHEAIASKSLPCLPGEEPQPAAQPSGGATAADSGPDPMQQLDSLVGLKQVKSQLKSLTDFLAVNKQRHKSGLKVAPVSYHCVFTGNPGTGKTTVARILARIYKQLGILEKGQLVETDRSGLVAEYVGQTAVKTNKIIDKALGGVLFIDEAYTLAQGGDNDYGREAIATLLKRMEDDRDRLVVVLAGYPGEIEHFIDSNPGLRSRFNRYVRFEDYTEGELYQIFVQQARNFDYRLSPDAETALHELLVRALDRRTKDFGNARYVRNLFEKVIENQAVRLSHCSHIDAPDLALITARDFQVEE